MDVQMSLQSSSAFRELGLRLIRLWFGLQFLFRLLLLLWKDGHQFVAGHSMNW